MRSNNTIKPQSVHPPVHDGFSYLLRQSCVDENGRAKSGQAAIQRMREQREQTNIQPPTSNIEHPMLGVRGVPWMLGVRCWMLVVSNSNQFRNSPCAESNGC